MRRQPGNLRPVEEDRAGRRVIDAGDLVEERRLAGAVRADQGDDPAARDREVDVVRGDQPAELLADLRRHEEVVDHGAHQSSLGFAVGHRALVGDVVQRRVVDALGHLDLVSPLGDQTGRAEQHHQHDDDPVDPELVLRRVEVEPALLHLRADRGQPLDVQVAEDHPAEDHARETAHPAEDHHAEQEDGDVEVEVRRERARLEARVERARDAAEERADRVRPRLRPHQRDAHRRGGRLVLADRDPGATEPRALQPPAAEDREQERARRPSSRRARARLRLGAEHERRRSRASRSG